MLATIIVPATAARHIKTLLYYLLLLRRASHDSVVKTSRMQANAAENTAKRLYL